MRSTIAAVCLFAAACATTPPVPETAPAPAPLVPSPEETHFSELRQLTFGGENAEAYWGFGGSQLSLQARGPADGCDRIYTIQVMPEPRPPVLQSSGKGATTCAHFLCSAAMKAPNCSAEPPPISLPTPVILARMSGAASAAL